MLRGGAGGDLSILIGWGDTGDPIKREGGGGYTPHCPPGDKRSPGKDSAHHKAPLQSQGRFMQLPGQTREGARGVFNAVSQYQQEDSREKKQKNQYTIAFCGKLWGKTARLNSDLFGVLVEGLF